LTHEAFFTAINEARKRICITTPYFVPDLTILAALRSAAFRGLDVRLILPERGDSRLADFASRSYFPELLRAGGRVFLYQDGVLHGKTAMFDDNLTVVGSANMDIRSFRLNFELSCFARDAKFAQQMAAFYERTLPACRELTLEDVEQTSYLTRLAESAANLMSPLL
jgi:cardiolipin synthase